MTHFYNKFNISDSPKPLPQPPSNPCIPSPCGPYSQCQDYGGSPSCTCISSYMGSPPNCRP